MADDDGADADAVGDETQENKEEPVSVEDKEPEKSEKRGKKRKAESPTVDDEEFKAEESEEDDENTIEEQETKEGEVDHQKELDDLQVSQSFTLSMNAAFDHCLYIIIWNFLI